MTKENMTNPTAPAATTQGGETTTCYHCGHAKALHGEPVNGIYAAIHCGHGTGLDECQCRCFTPDHRAAPTPVHPTGEPTPDGCTCAAWKANIGKVNAPFIAATARNPHTYRGYDGEPFGYCPWCGSGLAAALPPATGTEVDR